MESYLEKVLNGEEKGSSQEEHMERCTKRRHIILQTNRECTIIVLKSLFTSQDENGRSQREDREKTNKMDPLKLLREWVSLF